MNDLTLICEVCGQAIHFGTGCLYVLHEDIHHIGRDPLFVAQWRTAHFSHRLTTLAGAYTINSAEFQQWTHVARWIGHLMEKGWFAATDWSELMRELSGEIPAKRIRVNAKAAA